MNKQSTAAAAVRDIPPGSTLMVGGFGLVGAPLTLMAALADTGVGGLTVISNNLGEPGQGLGRLLRNGQIRRAVGSFFTSNPEVAAAHQRGDLEVRLMPQGTMAEAIRAGGAGIGAFYVPASAGTLLAEGKEEREIGGRRYVLEYPLKADFALIRARTADELGNLIYARTARNFNPQMATAARTVIAEVDEIVPTGSLDPEAVVTPHLFVDRLVRAEIRLEEWQR